MTDTEGQSEDLTKLQREAADEMHRAVGRCLMEWAGVELWLNSLLLALAGNRDPAQWGAMWRALKSFDARLDVLRALMDKAQYRDEVRSDFNLLWSAFAASQRSAIGLPIPR